MCSSGEDCSLPPALASGSYCSWLRALFSIEDKSKKSAESGKRPLGKGCVKCACIAVVLREAPQACSVVCLHHQVGRMWRSPLWMFVGDHLVKTTLYVSHEVQSESKPYLADFTLD